MTRIVQRTVISLIITLAIYPICNAMGNQPKEELKSSGVSSIIVEGKNTPTPETLSIAQKTINLSEAQPCSITVQIPTTGKTTLSILNEDEQVVEVLVDKVLTAGPHAFFWNTANMPVGTYTVLLKAINEEKRDKIEILK